MRTSACLADPANRTVLDRTGIEGAYDFTISFSALSAVQNSGGADPNGALSIFDAIGKQLGLKLELAKRPAPVLVMDHIEQKPVDN